MIAVLRGIKKVDYSKKDTGERKVGIELHLERKPYPAEPFVAGSDVVFTEYIPVTDTSREFADRVLKFPLGAQVDLQYIQNGRYSNLVEVALAE